MAIYQTPTSRFFDGLRNVGVAILCLLVVKGFLSSESMIPNRQVTIDAKGLRSSYTTDNSFATKDAALEDITDDDGDGFIDTDTVVIDGDDDDLVPAMDDFSGPISLHLIGERHSGTKWMSSHLQKCFPRVRFTNNPFRWKHWFQDESIEKYDNERFVVVAQFRNPYTWTEAMRSFPHHAPVHFHLDWPDFVNLEWTMPRHGEDVKYNGWTAETSQQYASGTCRAGEFLPHQVIPCMADRTAVSTRGIKMQSLYELRNDGSGKPYRNILEMRKEKIENFLDVANFDRVQDLFVVRYEEAKLDGTATLIQQLEVALDQKAACSPINGDKSFRERTIPESFREYLKTHVDWETEAKIGYFPTDSY